MNKAQQRLVLISFLALLISDSLDYLSTVNLFPFNPAIFTAVLRFFSLSCLIAYARKTSWKRRIPKPAYTLLVALLCWNIITIVRGMINAQDYYDWRYLTVISMFYFILPVTAIVGIMVLYNWQLWKIIIKKVYLFALAFVPLSFLGIYLYIKLTISVWFFALMSAYIGKYKWKLLILLTALFVLVTGYEIRANFLRVAVAIALLLLYYIRNSIKLGWLNLVGFVFFLLPFIFLYLGITGQFNVFQPFDDDEEFIVVDGGKESSNLIVDTRTGLYLEVFNSVLSTNTLVFGGGATAKYKTEMFDLGYNIDERAGTEVGFLNTMLYSGIVGVLFYFLILAYAVYLGLNKSNNFYSKMIAMFIAFRWLLFFIEDVTRYDMNLYFLWIAIGMSFSNEFRMLTDQQIKVWTSKYITR